MERTPLVSIGVPVYNGEKYLEQTLASLLDSELENLELVICDNASTDATPEICKDAAVADPRVRYERNESNIGLANNFNRVFALSRGKYFRWAMADDFVAPWALTDCLDLLEEDPGLVLAVPRWGLVDGEGRPHEDDRLARRQTWPEHPGERLRALIDLVTAPEGIAVLAYLSGVVRTSSLWRTRLLGSYPRSDQVLLAELALQGRWAETERRAMSVRIHSESAGNGIGDKDYARVYATFFPDRSPEHLLHWRLQLYMQMLRVVHDSPLPTGERARLEARLVRRWVAESPPGAKVAAVLGRLEHRRIQGVVATPAM